MDDDTNYDDLPAEAFGGKTSGEKSLPWDKDPVIIARMRKVGEMHLAGRPYQEIATAVGVSLPTVRKDVERLSKGWREQAFGELEDMRARAIVELTQIKVKALEAAGFDLTAESALLFGVNPDGTKLAHELQRPEHYDKEGNITGYGSISFRGNKSAALQAARATIMDIAKLQGIVVDKVSPTDAKGNTLDLATLVLRAQQTDNADS